MKMMKKLLFCLIAALLLTACGDVDSKDDVRTERDNKVSITIESQSKSEKENENAEDIVEESTFEQMPDYTENYTYSENEDYNYSDYNGYDGYDGYDGYGGYGNYDDGIGGYLCDYGSFVAKDSNGNYIATLNVYNSNGAMFADFTLPKNENESCWGSVYTDASEAFGHADRNTEVEMYVEGDEYGNNYYSEEWMKGGSLKVIVYYPSQKADFEFIGGNGQKYSYTMYKD